MTRQSSFVVATSLVLLLAACGGGGSEPAVSDPLAEVPASASQSSAGMARYIAASAAAPADSREPVALDAFNPPKPDDTEPEAVSN